MKVGVRVPIVLVMERQVGDSPRTEELSGLEGRIQRLSAASIIALVLAVVMATFIGAGIGEPIDSSTAGVDGPRLGGDYAAFYGAGSIFWEGDFDSLYDAERQELAQVGLGIDGYLAFAYPPHVAASYAPLAALPFQISYLVHTLLMAGAFVGALWILSPVSSLLVRWRIPLIAAGFMFYPLGVAIGGGQNASLTVLGLAVVWRGLHDDREWLAGVAAGLMMYRPQYALAVIGLMLLSRHWRAVMWAAATTVVTWAATAALFGVNWVSEWIETVLPFVERDAEVNAANSISALGFFQAAFSVDSTFAVVIGFAIAGSVVLTLMFLWAQPDRFTLGNRMGALAIGILLISPHTNFYDAATLVIAAVAILARNTRETAPIGLLVLGWVAVLVHPLTSGVRATPLAIVIVAGFIGMVVSCFGAESLPGEPDPIDFDSEERELSNHA